MALFIKKAYLFRIFDKSNLEFKTSIENFNLAQHSILNHA